MAKLTLGKSPVIKGRPFRKSAVRVFNIKNDPQLPPMFSVGRMTRVSSARDLKGARIEAAFRNHEKGTSAGNMAIIKSGRTNLYELWVVKGK